MMCWCVVLYWLYDVLVSGTVLAVWCAGVWYCTGYMVCWCVVLYWLYDVLVCGAVLAV